MCLVVDRQEEFLLSKPLRRSTDIAAEVSPQMSQSAHHTVCDNGFTLISAETTRGRKEVRKKAPSRPEATNCAAQRGRKAGY